MVQCRFNMKPERIWWCYIRHVMGRYLFALLMVDYQLAIMWLVSWMSTKIIWFASEIHIPNQSTNQLTIMSSYTIDNSIKGFRFGKGLFWKNYEFLTCYCLDIHIKNISICTKKFKVLTFNLHWRLQKIRKYFSFSQCILYYNLNLSQFTWCLDGVASFRVI